MSAVKLPGRRYAASDYDAGAMNRRNALRHSTCILLVVLAAGVAACAADCPSGQARTGEALAQQERAWAKSLEQHDVAALGCILAEEFQDADPTGKLHDRSQTLAGIQGRRPGTHQLSQLESHVHGDWGYIRGLATLVDASGNTRARVRFTDIYVYRDGRWQAVAGQETFVPQENPPGAPAQ